LVKESGGELKRGTIYVTLGRMEDKGLVESDLEKLGGNEPGPARRLYSITGQGVRVLRVWTLMKNAWVRGLSVA
jgi:DNA-binding PadR family transcriptional regulator